MENRLQEERIGICILMKTLSVFDMLIERKDYLIVPRFLRKFSFL